MKLNKCTWNAVANNFSYVNAQKLGKQSAERMTKTQKETYSVDQHNEILNITMSKNIARHIVNVR